MQRRLQHFNLLKFYLFVHFTKITVTCLFRGGVGGTGGGKCIMMTYQSGKEQLGVGGQVKVKFTCGITKNA